MLAPAHAGLATHDINHALQVTVVMCAGFRIRLDRHGPGPQFLCTDASKINRRLAIHAGRRRHIGIELIAWNDADAIMLPSVMIVRVVMRMIV